MSAEQYGAKLLGEVQEESLDEVSLVEVVPLRTLSPPALRRPVTIYEV